MRVRSACTPGFSDAQCDFPFPTGLLYILHETPGYGCTYIAYRAENLQTRKDTLYVDTEVSSIGGNSAVGGRGKQRRAVVDNCQEGARVNYSQQISDSFPAFPWSTTFGDQSDTLIFPVVSSRTEEGSFVERGRSERNRHVSPGERTKNTFLCAATIG